MAKKRPKKKRAVAGNIAKAILAYTVAFIIVVVLSGGLAGFLIYRVGVCFGVIAGGVTAFLCGLLWLGATPYEKTPEDAKDVEDGILLILLTGLANFDRCIPQMITTALGIIAIIAGIGGWILLAQVNPELNRSINLSFEMKKKDQAPPRPK